MEQEKTEYGVGDEKEVDRITSTFQAYKGNSARTVWEQRGYEYEAFVRNDIDGSGTQLTKAQIQEIKKKYGIPLSVNIAHAIKDQMMAIITSAEPSISCVPVGEASNHWAYVWREIILGNLQVSKFQSQLKRCLGHMVDVGHGVITVRPNRYYKRNIFNCIPECVKWNYVYFDPQSEDPFFQDSEMQFIAIPIRKSKAKKEYGLTDKELEVACSTFSSMGTANSFNPMAQENIETVGPGGKQEGKIWVMNSYEKVPATVYIMEDGTRTTVKPEEIGITPEGKLVGEGNYIDSYEDVFIYYCINVGNYMKYKTIMPISMYPNIPFVYTNTDSPFSISVMHHTIDIYKTANKALALTIENAQKGANTGWVAYEGSIQNKDAFEVAMSTPGGVAEIEPNPALPNGGMPTQKQTQSYTNAWFGFFRELIKLVEYVSGMLDLVQGHSENAPETADATRNLITGGTQRVKMLTRGIDYSMEQLCDLMIEFVQAYSPRNNILTYVSDTEAKMRIRTDVEGSLQQQQNGDTSFQEQENGQQLATIVENLTTQKLLAIVGTPKIGQYKIRYQSASNMPSTRLAAQQIITSAISRMQGDSTALALLKASLKLLSIPEIDKVLDETDIIAQQNEQIQQLSGQLDQIAKEAKDMENKYYDEVEKTKLAEIGADVQNAQSRIDVELAKLKEGVKDANKKTDEQKKKALESYS